MAAPGNLDYWIDRIVDSRTGAEAALRHASLDELVAAIEVRVRSRASPMRMCSALSRLDHPSTVKPLFALLDDPKLANVERSLALDSLAYHARTLKTPLGVLGTLAIRDTDFGREAVRYMIGDGHRIPWPQPAPATLQLRARLTTRSLVPLLRAIAKAEVCHPEVVEEPIAGEPSHWSHARSTTTWKAGACEMRVVTESHWHDKEGGGSSSEAAISSAVGTITMPSTLDRFDIPEALPELRAQLAAVLSELGWSK